jgi:copper(I)-binding protein
MSLNALKFTSQMPARTTLLTAVVAAVAIMAGGLAPHAKAHDYKLGEISIGHIWAPPTASDADAAAVYGPLLNRGASKDYLLGAASPIAETVRIRRKTDGEVQWLDKIALDPNKPVSLADWRAHIWLDGLKEPLKKGTDFPLTLEFAKAGAIEVTVVVEDAAGH